jgi:diaminohydroxyphosphoribosylaminopyrimidine deaminase/5-amino-6-(5-phosphoribosylamino)uracil reductase
LSQKIKNKDYMQLALELARRGFGNVEPNPIVGCVIVKDGRVIGKGWHRKFGGPHAEINALNDCRKNGYDPAGSVMVVTLEPCCHKGKTGPCTEAIIKSGITKVVVAMLDPTDKVGGRGVEQLKKAGIVVKTGLCEQQARLLNPAFIKFAKTAKPWVILKWAQTIDGKLASRDKSKRWISDDESRKDVHKIRRSCQAILVGINTVIADDPLLTPRPSKGKKLLRIVLDGNLRIPLESGLVNTIDQGDVLIVRADDAAKSNLDKAEKIEKQGAEILVVPKDSSGRCDLEYLLNELGKRDIQCLLVEGGPTVISSFLKKGFADELVVYIAPVIFARQGKADISKLITESDCLMNLNYTTTEIFGRDVKIKGFLRRIDEI